MADDPPKADQSDSAKSGKSAGADDDVVTKEMEDYVVLVSGLAQKKWHSTRKQNLNTSVVILVVTGFDASGGLVNPKLTQSSGNDLFDAEVMEALNKCVPFPKPPNKLVGRFIQLTFKYTLKPKASPTVPPTQSP